MEESIAGPGRDGASLSRLKQQAYLECSGKVRNPLWLASGWGHEARSVLGKPKEFCLHPGARCWTATESFSPIGENSAIGKGDGWWVLTILATAARPAVTMATSSKASEAGSSCFHMYEFDPQDSGLNLRQIAGATYSSWSSQASEQFQHSPSKAQAWSVGPAPLPVPLPERWARLSNQTLPSSDQAPRNREMGRDSQYQESLRLCHLDFQADEIGCK